jgi:hypothetical protein
LKELGRDGNQVRGKSDQSHCSKRKFTKLWREIAELKEVIRKHESKARDTEDAETNTKTAPAPVAPSWRTNTSQASHAPVINTPKEPFKSSVNIYGLLGTSEPHENVLSHPTSHAGANKRTAAKGRDSNLKPENRKRSRLDVYRYSKEISTAGITTITTPDMNELDRIDKILEEARYPWSGFWLTDPGDSNIRYKRLGGCSIWVAG